MTMSSADFLDEWFETDVLKATMSASGIIGTFMGPRSPGTAYVLLHHYMGELDGAFRSWGFPRGGIGSISRVIAEAARHHGAEIRTEAPVDQVLIKNGRAHGVVLAVRRRNSSQSHRLRRRSEANIFKNDRRATSRCAEFTKADP